MPLDGTGINHLKSIVMELQTATITVNPFLRLRKDAKFSLGRLAQVSRIDRKALSRAESGMYTNPPPSLVEFWVKSGKISEGVLVTEYEDYVYDTRRLNLRRLGETLNFDFQSSVHPLRQLRSSVELELTAFCKALCLPLDTIQFFEKKWRTQQSVPKGLILALSQNGYSRAEILTFQFTYADWRTSKLEKAYTYE